MEATLLAVGLFCLVGAVVGGDFKGFGLGIRALKSVKRQVMLGILGALLTGVALQDRWTGLIDNGAQDSQDSDATEEGSDIRTADGSDFQNVTQEAQYRLIVLGFDVGWPGGTGGQKTKASLAAFQRQHDLPISGTADQATLELLRDESRRAIQRFMSEEEDTATDYQRQWLPSLVD